MTLEEILALVKQGISSKELRPLVQQFVEENPDINWQEELQTKVSTGDISKSQQGQVSGVFGSLTEKKIEEETPLAALLGPAGRAGSAFMAKTAGATITNRATGEVIKTIPPTLLNKIGTTLLKMVIPKSKGGFPFLGKVGLGAGATVGTGAFLLATDQGGAAQATPFSLGRATGETSRSPTEPFRGTIGQEQGPATPANIKSGFNVLVVDHSGSLTGTPGAIAIMTPQDLGMASGMTPGQQVNISSQAVMSPDLQALATQLGISDVTAIPSLTRPDVAQVIFPETLEDIRLTSPFEAGRTRIATATPRPGGPLEGTGTAEESERLPITRPGPGIPIPAGAELQPRIFNTHGSRTLLEWASTAAKRYNVPLNILYGVIAHESGWNPNAVGDNGQSHGLAQIFMPVWGDQVSRAQALNPAFALNWTARMLRERFNQYGRWDAAVAAHNSPVAAEFLVSTGKFKDAKSQSYVLDVLTKSNNSGLANYIASADDTATEVADPGGTGPAIAAFEAPDPAASRQYIKEVYQEKLGRSPTEDELRKEVDRIKQLARRSYDTEVRRIRGAEVTKVDPAAQFEEGIESLGEFAFHEETLETQSFTDHAAGIARLLQAGL